MTRYLAERGVESRFVNGLRVTTPEVLDAVVKVFAGSVNADLVSALRAAGARPVGLTGIDAGLVDAELLDPALGHVGRPVHADARLLEVLMARRLSARRRVRGRRRPRPDIQREWRSDGGGLRRCAGRRKN